jgi:hypothetical protein
MNGRRIVAAVLALAIGSAAHAGVSVELGAGQTAYHPQSDGIWYQLGTPHHLGLSGRAYMIGLTGDVWRTERVGLAWHAGYIDLGRASAWCECTTDDNYDYLAHRAREPGIPGGTFSGTGRARGLQAALESYVTLGSYRIGYQWGVTRMQPRWRDTVYTPAYPAGYVMPIPRSWRTGRVSGLSIGSGQASLVYLHYTLPSDAALPALFKGADTLMFVWQFKP